MTNRKNDIKPKKLTDHITYRIIDNTIYLFQEKEDILDDNYGIWEFITRNYSYTEVMDGLSRNFFDDVIEEMVKTRLENGEFFCVREFPD